jgi:hypothetical protein
LIDRGIGRGRDKSFEGELKVVDRSETERVKKGRTISEIAGSSTIPRQEEAISYRAIGPALV